MENVYWVLSTAIRTVFALFLTVVITAVVLLVVAFFTGYGPESCHANWEAANRRREAEKESLS